MSKHEFFFILQHLVLHMRKLDLVCSHVRLSLGFLLVNFLQKNLHLISQTGIFGLKVLN